MRLARVMQHECEIVVELAQLCDERLDQHVLISDLLGERRQFDWQSNGLRERSMATGLRLTAR